MPEETHPELVEVAREDRSTGQAGNGGPNGGLSHEVAGDTVTVVPSRAPILPPVPPGLREADLVEVVPDLVPDPFDERQMLAPRATPPPSFNLVDGTVAFVNDETMPFVLYKGTNPDTWFYAPRWGRIAKGPDGKPAFLLSKKVRNNPDGSKTTVGGVLSFMVELVTELPGPNDLKKWAGLIKTQHNLQPRSGAFSFQPMRLAQGKMNVSGLDMFARPGQALKNIDVGASSSIGFAIELTPDGADHFAAMLGASPLPFPPQVAILFDFKYQYLMPQCKIQARGSKKALYDYFSWNAKARASYFGLVNASAEYQSVRADLRKSEALTVTVVGTPPAGVDLAKLLDAIFDSFVKMQVGQWIEPNPKPVEAPAPGGFFGGVSVAMKKMSFSDSATFTQDLNFATVNESLHQVSFNFEQQVSTFDPKRHLFIEQDDVKLPFKLAIGGSNKVKVIAPSASYTTATGPQNVQCQAVGTEGGLSEGVIQFTFPKRPTSAQISLVVNFVSPFGPGYIFRQTEPVSDTGAAFLFEPDQFVQRTMLIFEMALDVQDPSSKALFKWEWTPPQGTLPPGTAPRPKLSGFTLVTPDPSGAFNVPSYDIEFPYHPEDWKGEATPKIQYKIQGMSGDWKGRSAAGTITIGETALLVGWDAARAIGDGALALPRLLTQSSLLDPAFEQRMLAQFGALEGPGEPDLRGDGRSFEGALSGGDGS